MRIAYFIVLTWVLFSPCGNIYADTLKLSYHYVDNDILSKKNDINNLNKSFQEFDSCLAIFEDYVKKLAPFDDYRKITPEDVRLNTNIALQNQEIYQLVDYKPKNLLKYGIDTSVIVNDFPIYISFNGKFYSHIRLNNFHELYRNNIGKFHQIMTSSKCQPISSRSDMFTEPLTEVFIKAYKRKKVKLIPVTYSKPWIIEGLTLIGDPIKYNVMKNYALEAKKNFESIYEKYFIPIDKDYYYWGEKAEGCCFGPEKNKFVPVGIGYIRSFNRKENGYIEGLGKHFNHALIELPSTTMIASKKGLYPLWLGWIDEVKVYEAWVYTNSRALSLDYYLTFSDRRYWLDKYLDIMNVRIPGAFDWFNPQVYVKNKTFAIYSRGKGQNSMDESTSEGIDVREGVFIGFNGSIFNGRIFFDTDYPNDVKINGLPRASGSLYSVEPRIGTRFSGNFALKGSNSNYAFIPSDGYVRVTRSSTNGTVVSDEYWENGAFVMSRADRESLLYAEGIKREKEEAEQYEQERKRAEAYAEALKQQRKVKTLLNSGAYDYEIDKSVQRFFSAGLLSGGKVDVSMIENEIKRIETEVLYRDLSKSEEQYFLKIFEGKMNMLLGLLKGANANSKGTAKSTPRGSSGGKSVCQACNGNGELACQTCQGKGKYTCTQCNGRGNQGGKFSHVRCPHCHDGIEKCHKCGGDGYDQCNTCRGTGKL